MIDSPAQLRVPLAVTTNGRCPPSVERQARAAAATWGLPFFHRGHKAPLAPMLEAHADAFLVFGNDAVTLWDREGSAVFAEGIAHLRVRRIDDGMFDDLLLRFSELKPGEQVLDCTLGLAQDALVAARAVGPQGRVVGLEKSIGVFALVSSGLAALEQHPSACRVKPVHADYAEFLRSAESKSFDVVLIDPMFERPKKSQPSFELLRRHAEHARLTPEALADARRVARRLVLVKGSRYSRDLRELGIEPQVTSRSQAVVWGTVAPTP